jgi:enoyl-CoA hydratase/carnithine racemase
MDFIRVETSGPVTTVTLNRPQVMNAINAPMHAELQAAFDAFAAADDQWICVVTGAGERAFCAGSDLKAAVAFVASTGEVPRGTSIDDNSDPVAFRQMIAHHEKPVP